MMNAARSRRGIIVRKDIGLGGVMVVSGLLLGFTPWAAAAEYSVQFGELRGADHQTLVPMSNIKLCDKSTGYRFGYKIVPPGSGSYEYSAIIYLPAPPAQMEPKNSVISEGGKQIKTAAKNVIGPSVDAFGFDKGDPSGSWKIDVVVQNSVVATIKFDVAAASSCP